MLLVRPFATAAFLLLVGVSNSACGPSVPPLKPSSEPSTASVDEEGVVSVRLMPPEGAWVPNEVEVDNAKLVSRDGDSPLQLQVQRSTVKRGETTVEGADEPIRVTVVYIDQKTKEKGRLVFVVAAGPDAKPGAPISVSVEP